MCLKVESDYKDRIKYIPKKIYNKLNPIVDSNLSEAIEAFGKGLSKSSIVLSRIILEVALEDKIGNDGVYPNLGDPKLHNFLSDNEIRICKSISDWGDCYAHGDSDKWNKLIKIYPFTKFINHPFIREGNDEIAKKILIDLMYVLESFYH